MLLRTQFNRGIRNSITRENLLQEFDIEFQEAIEIAVTYETYRVSNREIVKGDAIVSNEMKTANCVLRSSYNWNSKLNFNNKSKLNGLKIWNCVKYSGNNNRI